MISNARLMTMLLVPGALGCNLHDDRKDACMQPGDCVDGLLCVDQRCVDMGMPDAGRDSHGPSDPPDPDAASPEYGTVEPITVETTGLAVALENTLLGVTATAGNLGCAIVGDPAAAPGGRAAVVYAAVDREGSDRRCPDGVYGIQSDPSCVPDLLSQLRPGCAFYKRWDASGTQVALRTAIGGHVAVQNIVHTASSNTCNVEISIAFAGGVTVESTISFDFSPFGTAESFCVH